MLQLLQHQQQQEHERAINLKAHQKSPFTNKPTEYAKSATGTRIGMKRGGGGVGGGVTEGEIIQVQGGHIIRATGRKDRHSKVFTAKGPRDRRVRLSAHTAIQFYDVQDRLGYDRPSKAVDWLIKKAKNAIDKLSESQTHQNEISMDPSTTDSNPGSESSSRFASQFQQQLPPQVSGSNQIRPNSAVIQSAVAESQSIANSMKAFFPISSGNLLMNMQSYPHERMSLRPQIQTEDLGLSLHSTLQDEQNLNHRANYTNEEVLLSSGPNPIPFEANYQKAAGNWENDANAEDGENIRTGFIFNSNNYSIPQQVFYNPTSAFSQTHQREPLQSNYSHLLHSWINEKQLPSVDHHNSQPIQQSSAYNIHFGSNFQVPARIHGEDEPAVSPNSQI